MLTKWLLLRLRALVCSIYLGQFSASRPDSGRRYGRPLGVPLATPDAVLRELIALEPSTEQQLDRARSTWSERIARERRQLQCVA